MAVDDLDIYRAARLLIDQHGDKAPIHAAMRADELLDAGNLAGPLSGAGLRKPCESCLNAKPLSARQLDLDLLKSTLSAEPDRYQEGSSASDKASLVHDPCPPADQVSGLVPLS